MKLFDVVIIGGGPAGAVAGYTLGKAGLKVLIIDQNTFPRRKVCGGGLTLQARKEIPFDISEIVHQEVDSGQIGFRGQLIKTIHNDFPIAFMIDRVSFDAFLLNKAVSQGVETSLGQRAVTINKTRQFIQVTTDQETFAGKHLIGADGVHSMVAKHTNLIKNRVTSLAYEARLSKEINPNYQHPESITFDFGTILFGYAWIFPKRDHLNVGVCRTWPGKKASKKHLLRYIDQHSALHRDRIIDIRAFPVPMGGHKTILHKNNILLVGDAANLADPWLGEGLYYAIHSGRLGAETIIKHINLEIPDLAAYTDQVNKTCAEQFPYAKNFSLLVNLLPYINVYLLKSSKTLQNIVMNLITGEMTYHQAWQSLIAQSPHMLWSILKGENK